MWEKFKSDREFLNKEIEIKERNKKLFDEWLYIAENIKVYGDFKNILICKLNEFSLSTITLDDIFNIIKRDLNVEIPEQIKFPLLSKIVEELKSSEYYRKY